MNWIVLWTILTVTQIPCPGYGGSEKREKYGLRGGGESISCAVMHIATTTREESKLFESSTTAKQFLDEMPIDKPGFFFGLGEHITKAEMRELK